LNKDQSSLVNKLLKARNGAQQQRAQTLMSENYESEKNQNENTAGRQRN
jgi:hypothetical protein